ncbi:hypothetical protein JKF63_04358 [Porcisia hertigi]|uniref:DUF7883 domain-containing protein n=1 Tax=Porcisia hertigi TaxID=2761500 RepID=A0A836HSB9_9TRYP|nr:hypothetical protein JKF63_04358 [Porcisia hertigi]
MRLARTGRPRQLAYRCFISLPGVDLDAATSNARLGSRPTVLSSLRCSTAAGSATVQERYPRDLLLGCGTSRFQNSWRGPPLRTSRRLHSVQRNVGRPSDDDQLIAYFRSVLRSTGPVPISKLASMVGDEYLERLGREGGGLAQFMRRHPETFSEVQLPGRVHVAMANETCAAFRTGEQKSLGLRIIGLLTIAQHMPGTQVATSLGFSTPTPTVSELSKVLRHWSLITPVQLARFLNQYTGVFRLHPSTQQVRLRSVKSVAAPPQPSLPEHSPPDTKDSRFQLWLSTVVPSQYHVPVSYIMDSAATANTTMGLFSSPQPSLEDIRLAFQELPPQFVDVRAFGSSPMAIFVRLLRPEPLFLQVGVPAYTASSPAPEVAASRYDPTLLGRRLTEALQKGAAEDHLMRMRLLKGLDLAHLRECVPAEVVHAIEVFYGLVEGGDLRVSVLLLDRLRHLWEVQLNSSRVRPWAFLAASEQPSSLTLETSPVPRVMVHLQRMLADKGAQLPADLYADLPQDLQTALLRTYAPLGGADESCGAATSSAPEPSPDTSVSTQVMCSFVNTHSLFFLKQGDLIYTPRLAAEQLQRPKANDTAFSEAMEDRGGTSAAMPLSSLPAAPLQGKPEGHMSDLETAKFLHDILPVGQPVMVDALRNALLAEHHRRGMPPDKARKFVRREFFERHKRFFTLYEYFAYDKLVVGRAEDSPPPPHVLQPRMTCIEHVIKFIALLSSNSATDGTLTRSLPRDGRVILKSIGSVTDLVEQLPMWFLVQRDKHNFSSSLIRYIGPQAESETPSEWALKRPPTGVLTRKVPNNPFADIGPEEVDDMPVGWNEDWNEEEHDGGAEQEATTPPLARDAAP